MPVGLDEDNLEPVKAPEFARAFEDWRASRLPRILYVLSTIRHPTKGWSTVAFKMVAMGKHFAAKFKNRRKE